MKAYCCEICGNESRCDQGFYGMANEEKTQWVYYPCGLEYIPSRQCNGGGKQRHIMWQCIMGWHGKRVRPQAAVCGTAGRSP